MDRDRIRARVIEVLGTIAPETDPAAIAAGANLRQSLDVDSMDFVNFALGLQKAFGVQVPEADFPRLYTLDGCVEYLAGKLARG